MLPCPELFALGEGVYLLSHSVGRAPRRAEAALARDFLDPWMRGADEPWNAWLAAVQRFRDGLAALLSAPAAGICPQPNLSSALTRILGALPRDRSVLLQTESDFPSLGFVLGQAERCGYRRRFIGATEDLLDPDTWRRHLQPDVGLVLVTHVLSNTSRRVPLAEILPMARERGIRTVVDVAQSAGIVPLDIGALQPDFVIGSCVKWLCGGPGAGFLWASAEMLRLAEPTDVGWFSHADPFAFDIHDFRYAPDARRFWGGTPSVAPFALAAESLAVLREIGIAKVQAHNLRLVQRLIDAVDPRCLRSPAASTQRGGTVVLHFGERQEAVTQRLHDAGVRFDGRASGLRLSPHVYNTDADLNLALGCLV